MQSQDPDLLPGREILPASGQCLKSKVRFKKPLEAMLVSLPMLLLLKLCCLAGGLGHPDIRRMYSLRSC